MTLNLEGATQRQREFITDLLSQRDFVVTQPVNSPADASKLIGELLMAPRKEVAVKPFFRVDEELVKALSSVPKSKYAIPTSELMLELFDEKIDNDLLFVEIKEYQKTLYLRRLHGAVGSFVRTKMSRKDTLAILRLLSIEPYKYTKLFGEHYSCCGKCGAELTDAVSRRLQLGPDCRKAFGF